MKKALSILILVLALSAQGYAQKSICDNTILIYAPPTVITNLDSTVRESIQTYFRRYLISQQQAFNYKLVEQRDGADLELITSYTLKHPYFWEQTTEMEFTIRDIENPKLSRTIIEAYNTMDSSLYLKGKDVISHQGSDFLETLQIQNSLYPFFAPLLDKTVYRHKAAPDMVIVFEEFTTELEGIEEHLPCLQEFVLKGIQGRARFSDHNINISFGEAPNTTPEGTPVITVSTEIEDFADEYVLVFSSDMKPYLNEFAIPKHLLDLKHYRPFIIGKVAAYSGGLIDKVLY